MDASCVGVDATVSLRTGISALRLSIMSWNENKRSTYLALAVDGKVATAIGISQLVGSRSRGAAWCNPSEERACFST